MTGKRDYRVRSSSALALLIVAALILMGVAAWAWSLDQRLQQGILAQRQQAMQRPDWVPLPSLPPHVPAAFLTVVDPLLLERNPLRDGLESSSLSRALVSQIHRLEHGVRGDAKALFMAPLLASHLSRAELLELYLNRMYLGEDDGWPVFGVYHAAHEYLGKDPGALTVGEAATLAGLLLPPRVDDPEASAGAMGARRNEVLRQMRNESTITEEEYRIALAEPLAFQPGPEFVPMTRPADWQREPDVIRVPASPSLVSNPRE